MRLFFILGLAVALAFPSTASADPMPTAPIYPSNGATLQVVPSGYVGVVNYGCPPYRPSYAPADYNWTYYYVEFASRPDLGPDGTLATAFTVDSGNSFPTNAAETECKSQFRLASTPGTYYWQIKRMNSDSPTGWEVSPVWSFTLVPKPASPGTGTGQNCVTRRVVVRRHVHRKRHRHRNKRTGRVRIHVHRRIHKHYRTRTFCTPTPSIAAARRD